MSEHPTPSPEAQALSSTVDEVPPASAEAALPAGEEVTAAVPQTAAAPEEPATTATEPVADAPPEAPEPAAAPAESAGEAAPEAPAAEAAPETAAEAPVAEAAAAEAAPEVPAAGSAPETPAAEPAPEAPAAEAAPEAPAAEAAPEASADAAPEASAEAPATEPATEPAADAPAEPASPAPKPSAVPKPSALPKPSAVPHPPAVSAPATAAPAVVPVPVDDAKEAAEAAGWGRVDPDGTVWVREASGERTVGQYTGADSEEALGFYVRRFLELQAQVALLEARLPQLSGNEIDQTIEGLTESLAEPAAVGDLDGLRTRLETLRERAAQRKAELTAEREAAREAARAERTTIVERAEAIAALDPAKTHWRSSGEELRALLDQWKAAQRSGPRLSRSTEDGLWKRFSRARTTFDRNRGHYFSELDARQGEVKRAKEKLVERAEALSSSTEWGPTSAAYRGLMDEWKASGRANRKDDDALWARFRAAQQVFFDARNEQNARTDAEFAANLVVKLEILEQAEALLPVTDADAAKAALRPLQEKWDEAGKVPRADVQRVEARMRAVEQAVRDADDERWRRSDPEKQARAEGMAAQLHDSIAQLEKELADAEATGDARSVKRAREALEARQAWLTQVLRATGD